VHDEINVLSINNKPQALESYTFDQLWKIVNQYIGQDGYIDTKKVVLSFAEIDDIITDPDTFDNLTGSGTSISLQDQYIILEKYTVDQGQDDYRYRGRSQRYPPNYGLPCHRRPLTRHLRAGGKKTSIYGY
jgi:hypothetical protein